MPSLRFCSLFPFLLAGCGATSHVIHRKPRATIDPSPGQGIFDSSPGLERCTDRRDKPLLRFIRRPEKKWTLSSNGLKKEARRWAPTGAVAKAPFGIQEWSRVPA